MFELVEFLSRTEDGGKKEIFFLFTSVSISFNDLLLVELYVKIRGEVNMIYFRKEGFDFFFFLILFLMLTIVFNYCKGNIRQFVEIRGDEAPVRLYFKGSRNLFFWE